MVGLIENMSYIRCDHCGERIDMPMEKQVLDIPTLAKLPYKKEISVDLAKSMTSDIVDELERVLNKILIKR